MLWRWCGRQRCSGNHTLESSSWRTEEAECHEEAAPPHATLLTETLVGVVMCSFGCSQPRISADDADEPFQVAGSSRAEERCGNSPHPEHNQLRECGVTRERKSQSPGGAAKLLPIQKWSVQRQGQQQPAVQRKETDDRHRGSGYDTDGLSQRRRSYGSEPRREDRDESALRADD